MSLFRQQALEQHRLPDPMFTPVKVVAVRGRLWFGIIACLLCMLGIWLMFVRLYTTYDTTITVTGSQTSFILPVEVNLTHSVQAVASCPAAVRGIVTPQTDHTAVLQLELPLQAECHITLILSEESPLERFLP